jgi:hypothetical protein
VAAPAALHDVACDAACATVLGSTTTKDDAPGNGVLHLSADGGATWVDTFRDTKAAASLMDIAALSPLEYWAVGAELGAVGPQYPTFYHTVDGGKTWAAGTASVDMLLMYAIAWGGAAVVLWSALGRVLLGAWWRRRASPGAGAGGAGYGHRAPAPRL